MMNMKGRKMNNRWRVCEQEKDDDKNDSESEVLTVETVGNHVYFYSGVDSDRCLALVKALRQLDGQLRNEYVSRDLPAGFPNTPIWLHIHSYGGFLMEALGVADQIKRFSTPVYSVIEGCCASAGTFISMACDRRYITPSSHMLIHQLSSVAWGKYEEIKDEVHLLDMLMESIVSFYVSHANGKKLNEERVKELLKRDSWFNARECLALGLVDEVL